MAWTVNGFYMMTSDMDKLAFAWRAIGHWRIPVLDFTFTGPVRDPLCLPIYGIVANSIPTSPTGKDRLENWQVQVASEVKAARGPKPWNADDSYVISLGLSFHLPSHGNQKKLDVENFIKPIIDALAAGLFCSPQTYPESIPKFDYDDSNFRTLLVHRLPDARSLQFEGAAIAVSASPR